MWHGGRACLLSYRQHALPAEPPSSEGPGMSSDEAASAIRESCLVPFLEAELSQASFTDMGNR